jgi:hypothetical protein
MALIAQEPSPDRNPWLETGWPFIAGGQAEPFQVAGVVPAGDGLSSLVEGYWRGLAVTIFDTVARARELVPDTKVVPAKVSGWALRATRIDGRVDRFQASTLDPDVRAALSRGIDASGELEIGYDGFAALLRADPEPSPLFHACGRIIALRTQPFAFAGLTLWSCDLIVSRDIRTDTETALTVHISSEVWGTGQPEVGQTLETLIWLQGVLETAATDDS